MRHETLLGAIGAALLVSSAAWAAGVRLNLTSSLPAGVYLVTNRVPTRGSIVLVCLPAPVATFARMRGYVPRGTCPGRAGPVGKTVLAIPGDTVRVLARELQLNSVGVRLSVTLGFDSRRRPLPSLPTGLYVVRPGELWLLGRHALSFDSRYFGPVPASSILAVVRPLWILGS